MEKTVREQVEKAVAALASARSYFDETGSARSLEVAEDAAIAMLRRNAALFAASAEVAKERDELRAEVERLKSKKCPHQLAKEFGDSAG